MFDRIALKDLPSAVQDIVNQKAASEQAKHEKRRSVLAKEIRAEEAAAAKEIPPLAAAVNRAIANREKAYAAWQDALFAERVATGNRITRGFEHDAYVTPRRKELIGLADPRIAAFCSELLELERQTVHVPVDSAVETREVPSKLSGSVRFTNVTARVHSNRPTIDRRLAAIRDALASAQHLREMADVDVGEAIAKLRATIPALALEKELVFDDKVLPPLTGLIAPVQVAGTPEGDPPYVDAWKPR